MTSKFEFYELVKNSSFLEASDNQLEQAGKFPPPFSPFHVNRVLFERIWREGMPSDVFKCYPGYFFSLCKIYTYPRYICVVLQIRENSHLVDCHFSRMELETLCQSVCLCGRCACKSWVSVCVVKTKAFVGSGH